VASRGRHPGGNSIRIVQDQYGCFQAASGKHRRQTACEGESFNLLQIRGFLYDSVPNYPGETYAYAVDLPFLRCQEHLLSDEFGNVISGHGPQRIRVIFDIRKDPDRTSYSIVLHYADCDLPGRQDTDCLPHLISPL
jgi:hypothetical protein